MKMLMPSASAATCLALSPQDNNVVTFGLQDATVVIYHIRAHKVLMTSPQDKNVVTGKFENSFSCAGNSRA